MKAAPVALIVLMALVPWSQKRVDRRLGTRSDHTDVLYLWSGEYVRRLCPGFEDLMADVYWLRTVQYFGGQKHAGSTRFDLLEPLTEITVTLDPRFEMAYHFGAIFMAEPLPHGAGQPERAIALLDRGARATGSWRLRQMQAYLTFVFLKDTRKAADILMEAARMPGAAYWLEALAARMLQSRGERDVARAIWKNMVEQSSGQIRANAETHLRVLDAFDGAEALQTQVEAFRKRHGRVPLTMDELTGGRVPRDPAGVPFEYDQHHGTVSVSPFSPLWRANM